MKSVTLTLLFGAVCCASALAISTAEAAKFNENALYSFCARPNCTDGTVPVTNLTSVRGMLYGTTTQGGANCVDENGCGAVFALDPTTGAETVLYSFCDQQNCADGSEPISGLIDVNGKLYGVTFEGGANINCSLNDELGCGTVFAINRKIGAERVVYSFCSKKNCADGAYPQASLINVNGMLYGTTFSGGNSADGGVVFAIDPTSGTEKVIYAFCSHQHCSDGVNSTASLIDVNGLLYGTTSEGGTSSGGTLFALDPQTGVETVVYSFCSQENCADGSTPWASLVNANGTLYGTTIYGGAKNYGTVFSVDLNTGAEKVMYSFCTRMNCGDGVYPESGLIDVKDILYGTTPGGGNANGGGTVFSLNPNTGAANVVYSFCSQQNCTDGEASTASLINVKGTLYGTTEYGGADVGGCSLVGCGTVYALTKSH